MPVTIDIIFAGLIAFVPNSSDDPSLMTAYLVNDPDHRPQLRVFGDVKLDPEDVPNDPFRCVHANIEGRAVIRCALSDTDISFETDTRRQYMRREPRKERPESPEERRSLEWLVRLENVESRTGRVLLWDDIDDKVGARLTFGWDAAQVCELDGDELGKPALVGFRSGNIEGPHSQAVAESVLFTASVDPGPIKITLRNRVSGAKRIITGGCARQHCLAISIENFMRPHGCDPQVDGGHFERYYDLVRKRDTLRRLPFRRDYQQCVSTSKDKEPLGHLLLECWLRRLRPAAPNLEQDLRKRIDASRKAINRKTLSKWIQPWLPSAQKEAKAKGVDAVSEFYNMILGPDEVQDRIICPPVVLEP